MSLKTISPADAHLGEGQLLLQEQILYKENSLMYNNDNNINNNVSSSYSCTNRDFEKLIRISSMPIQIICS